MFTPQRTANAVVPSPYRCVRPRTRTTHRPYNGTRDNPATELAAGPDSSEDMRDQPPGARAVVVVVGAEGPVEGALLDADAVGESGAPAQEGDQQARPVAERHPQPGRPQQRARVRRGAP